ncbi:hypothetical protein [Pseudoalteromonas denitrificans]|uniref:Uncharacterized protein n=1 Tax=Pseudoalteromonas denitrificans DSM 6059 TaxID=1123010 RepID=A0A1I1U9S0_9GAMM|nr:hypothetical protein [Pseudoalteromonas denitrificans]SFD67507.1 hypothetical protein SAMN02745724_05162 [Pseudoalteromonas denitrificans DSM 6059]
MDINLNNFEELALPILNKLAQNFPTFLGASALICEGENKKETDESKDVLSILQNQDLIFCNNQSCFQLTATGTKLFNCSVTKSLKHKIKDTAEKDASL